ncbi:MAG: peptide-methionine (S)-S-oxide reductase MsrA [Verrucomicrobiota bacterium]
MENETDAIVLGGGCFWCLEAVFEDLEGVLDVVSGYAGGEVVDPSYEQVCSGSTGHAEVVQITFDPSVTTLDEILSVFWRCHDPTTKDRQGADVGSQYRSIILPSSDQQESVARNSMDEAQKSFSSPIVTEITLLEKFYRAEDYHQDYYANKPNAPYCAFVIRPKLQKLGL